MDGGRPEPDAQAVADGIRDSGTFTARPEWRYAWQRAYTRDEWLDQMPAAGNAGQFRPGKFEELMAASAAAMGGAFAMDYTAVAITAVHL